MHIPLETSELSGEHANIAVHSCTRIPVTLNHWVVGSIPTRCMPQDEVLTQSIRKGAFSAWTFLGHFCSSESTSILPTFAGCACPAFHVIRIAANPLSPCRRGKRQVTEAHRSSAAHRHDGASRRCHRRKQVTVSLAPRQAPLSDSTPVNESRVRFPSPPLSHCGGATYVC
jgi:hypothetical protein